MKKIFFAIALATLVLAVGTTPSTPVNAQEKGKSAESKGKAETKGKSTDMGKDHEKQNSGKDKKDTKQQAVQDKDKGGSKNKK